MKFIKKYYRLLLLIGGFVFGFIRYRQIGMNLSSIGKATMAPSFAFRVYSFVGLLLAIFGYFIEYVWREVKNKYVRVVIIGIITIFTLLLSVVLVFFAEY